MTQLCTGCLSETVSSIFAKIELRANSAYFLKIISKLLIKNEITIFFKSKQTAEISWHFLPILIQQNEIMYLKIKRLARNQEIWF